MESPRAIKKTENDFLKKSLLAIVSDKCEHTQFEYESNNQIVRNYLVELKDLFADEPEFLHRVVWEQFSRDEDIQSALAHVKTTSSITTEFFSNEFLFTAADRIYLDFLILDCVGFSEPQRMRVLHNLIVDYGRGLGENLEPDNFLDGLEG